jgi:hypothetical protein
MKFWKLCKSYHHWILLATALSGTLILTASTYAAKPKGIGDVTPGKTLYTQFSLFYEKNRHLTTNYRRGTLVPVNTAVEFVKAEGKNIEVVLPDGQKLKISNVVNFSGENLDGIFNRTFAAKPLNLSSFSTAEQKAIMAGEVVVGMCKAAVIAALGYPPKHKTASLDLNQWQYWQSRFDTIIVYFDKDRVTQIMD